MKLAKICGNNGNSTILAGESIGNLDKYIPEKNVIIISDKNVRSLYGDLYPDYPVIGVEAGESNKSHHTVVKIYGELLNLCADRSVFILGIGGGIVCDITGFVASTYLRGVRFGYVATTLLSQADGSVGGKTGINFQGYKNIVGTFSQPEFVLCDFSLLKTIPREELLCGVSEILKNALIADEKMFDYMYEHSDDIKALDLDVISHLIFRSIQIKSRIVTEDENERGKRRILNYGHTFGHVLEHIAGLSHGSAVSVGTEIASRLSCRYGYLDEGEYNRIVELMSRIGLPLTLKFDREMAIETLGKDKKRVGEDIHFVFLKKIGRAFTEKISLSELDKYL